MVNTFSPDMNAPIKLNMKEVTTDGASMLAIDVLNNVKLSLDTSTTSVLAGTGVGLALWQYWGKGFLKKNLQKISISSIASDPASKTEAIVELDAELLIGLKGGLYSASVYVTSLIMKGPADRMNLVDAVLMGYGGSLAGAIVRNTLSANPSA